MEMELLSKLNFDIYHNIISYNSYNKQFLYACLQVSTIFAQIAVSQLYMNPWIFKKNYIFWPSITRTLIFSYSFDLFSFKVTHKTLFNYTSYCRYITYRSILQMSDVIFTYYGGICRHSLQCELYIMFLVNCKKNRIF